MEYMQWLPAAASVTVAALLVVAVKVGRAWRRSRLTPVWVLKFDGGAKAFADADLSAVLDNACVFCLHRFPDRELQLVAVRDPVGGELTGISCTGRGIEGLPEDGTLAMPIMLDGWSRRETFGEMAVRLLNRYAGKAADVRFCSLEQKKY